MTKLQANFFHNSYNSFYEQVSRVALESHKMLAREMQYTVWSLKCITEPLLFLSSQNNKTAQ
jgi:hypothetical protein